MKAIQKKRQNSHFSGNHDRLNRARSYACRIFHLSARIYNAVLNAESMSIVSMVQI